MKLDTDWIAKNWEFLSARRVKVINSFNPVRIMKDGQAPTQGKFYGTPDFIAENTRYAATTNTGSYRLFMRPYVIAPMPESGIKAIYIDPKRYEFDEEGNITGMKSLYELPIYVFKE